MTGDLLTLLAAAGTLATSIIVLDALLPPAEPVRVRGRNDEPRAAADGEE